MIQSLQKASKKNLQKQSTTYGRKRKRLPPHVKVASKQNRTGRPIKRASPSKSKAQSPKSKDGRNHGVEQSRPALQITQKSQSGSFESRRGLNTQNKTKSQSRAVLRSSSSSLSVLLPTPTQPEALCDEYQQVKLTSSSNSHPSYVTRRDLDSGLLSAQWIKDLMFFQYTQECYRLGLALLPPKTSKQRLIKLVEHVDYKKYDGRGLVTADQAGNIFGWQLPNALSVKWVRHMQYSGTLANRKLTLAFSSLLGDHDPPMLGLFANVDFVKGDVVTEYGGSLRLESEIRAQPRSTWSHTIRLPGSIHLRDGLAHSLCFQRHKPLHQSTKEENQKLKKSDCSPILASFDTISTAPNHSTKPTTKTKEEGKENSSKKDLSSLFFCSPALSEELKYLPLSEELKYLLVQSGIGYMANTSARQNINVKTVPIAANPNNDSCPFLFLVATKTISKGQEILLAYNNSDPLIVK